MESSAQFSPKSLSSLETIAKWGKFIGYAFIITGAIYAIFGLFAFVVGAIPGVIQIFLGLYLLRSSKGASLLIRQYETSSMDDLLMNYSKFLKVQGILLLIVIIMFLISIAIGGLGFISMLASFGS